MARLPETAQSLPRYLRAERRRLARTEDASPFSRSGLSVTAQGAITAAGQIQSADYNGTSPTALGTTGWALAKRADGSSRLVLDGRDVTEDLDAKDFAILGLINDLTTQQATLTAQQAALTATIAEIASRVTVSTSIATFNTGALPNDATNHEYGPPMTIVIDVPYAGHLDITVGCSEASMNSGGAGGAVNPDATFSCSGGVASMGAYSGRAYLTSPDTGVGAPLIIQRSFPVGPGTYTITGQMRAWATGSSSCSVNFRLPYLKVQVTG